MLRLMRTEFLKMIGDMGLVDLNAPYNPTTIDNGIAAGCNADGWTGCSAALEAAFRDAWQHGTTYGNNRDALAELGAIRAMMTTGAGADLNRVCGVNPVDIWDKIEGPNGTPACDQAEDWARDDQAPKVRQRVNSSFSEVDSRGRANPCKVIDAYNSWYSGQIVMLEKWYIGIMKILNNPLATQLTWDATPRNFGNNSFTSVKDAQDWCKTVRNQICYVQGGGTGHSALQWIIRYDVKSRNFNRAGGYRNLTPEDKKRVDNCVGLTNVWLKSLRFEVIAKNLAVYKSIEDDHYEEHGSSEAYAEAIKAKLSSAWSGYPYSPGGPASFWDDYKGYIDVIYFGTLPSSEAREDNLAKAFGKSRSGRASSMGLHRMTGETGGGNGMKTNLIPTIGDRQNCYYCEDIYGLIGGIP